MWLPSLIPILLFILIYIRCWQAHWAKIELPQEYPPNADNCPLLKPGEHSPYYEEQLESMRARIRNKYPVDEFNAVRRSLDPENVLSNTLIEELFADTKSKYK